MTARVCAASLPLRLGFLVIAMCGSLWSRPAGAATLTLTWDANTEPNIAGYTLSFGVTPGQYTSIVNVGKQTSYSFTEPDPTKKYDFAVRAYNTSGAFSPYSPEVESSATASSQPPPASGALTLTWDANTEPDIAGYMLSIGVARGQYTTTVDVGKQTTYLFSEPDATATYYFAVRAYNTAGQMSAYSLEVTSSPAPLPTVTTGAATSISGSGAILSGNANPVGITASGYFQYGATITYGSNTPSASLGAGTQAVAIPNGALSNLTCSSTYHFRAVALNASGIAYGNDKTLTTSACPLPTVTTGGAISISDTGATLTSTVNPNGSAATAAFQYGLTTAYGSTTAGSPVNSGMASVAIAAGGLSCAKLYHFRGVATNGTGSAYGADATFTTLACQQTGTPPTITGPPPDGTINSGDTVTMNVWASGTAPLTYQWYRGATGVTTNPIAGATSLSYKTPPLKATTTFWVRVSNGAGSVNSRTVTITVVKGKK